MTMREFTLSHFLRHSGEVLAALGAGDIAVRRRDDDDLVLTTARRERSRREALEILSRVVLSHEAGDEPECALERAVPWTSFLSADERTRMLRELASAGATFAQLEEADALAELLDAWRRRSGDRSRRVWDTRPVAIPDDVDDPAVEKASGVVELPLNVRWSGPKRLYDLDDPQQLRLVYEQILQEGTSDDVRRYIDVDALLDEWDRLVLPPRVRRAWADWFQRRRGVRVAC